MSEESKFKRPPEPAFPVSYEHNDARAEYHGMSLRDYFAGQALTGLATGYQALAAVIDKEKEFGGIDIAEMLSSLAYAHADAMLAERERKP